MADIMENAMPVETKSSAGQRTFSRSVGARNPTTESASDPNEASGLEIRLFGPLEVRVNGAPLPHLRSRKGLWLLALLALRGERVVDRDWLAGMLWPDCDEAHGRRSLRQSLFDLRQALGPEAWRLKSDPRAGVKIRPKSEASTKTKEDDENGND